MPLLKSALGVCCAELFYEGCLQNGELSFALYGIGTQLFTSRAAEGLQRSRDSILEEMEALICNVPYILQQIAALSNVNHDFPYPQDIRQFW